MATTCLACATRLLQDDALASLVDEVVVVLRVVPELVPAVVPDVDVAVVLGTLLFFFGAVGETVTVDLPA